MKTLMLTMIGVMLSCITHAQFTSVQTFGAKIQSIEVGTNTNDVILYSLNSTSGQLRLYNSDFQSTRTTKLHVPSGATIESLVAINEDFSNSSTGNKYAYTVVDAGNNKSICLSDEGGNLIKNFLGATHINVIQPGKLNLIVVSGNKNGIGYTDVYDTRGSVPVLKSFPSENLLYGTLAEGSTDSTDFFFYYIDTDTKELLGYDLQFSLAFTANLTVPAGALVLPTIYTFQDKTYNTTSAKEFGVIYEADGEKSALILDETGKVLQTLPNVESLEVVHATQNLIAFYNNEGKTKWDLYHMVEGKNFDNAELQLSLPNAPRTDGITNLCFKDNDSTIMRFASLGIHAGELSTKVDLKLLAEEELVKWDVLHTGNGDGDDFNQEIYFVAKNTTNNTYRFSIMQEGGKSLLEVKNVISFEFIEGYFTGTSTRLLLQMENGTTEVYDFDWSLKPATRISPKDKTNPVNDLNVTINWNRVKNANSYNVLIVSDTTDISKSSVYQATETDTFTVATGLQPSTTYYWLLRTRNANRSVFNVKRFYSFTTLDLSDIEKPELLGPMNSAKDLAKENVSIFWNSAKNATSFEYQISTTTDFSTFTSANTTDSSAKLVDLEYATQYFWRVRSVNGGYNSGWSAVWSFTTGDVAVVDPPALSSPTNFMINTATDISFEWEKVEGAISYELEYGTSPSFINPVSNTLSNTTYSVSNLNFSTHYFWRVRVTTADGTSYWSETWNFITLQAPRLGISTLIAPENNSSNVDPLSVTLKWDLIAEADGYKYQISTNPNFTDAELKEVSEGKALLENLEENTTYYWRVRSTKANANGEWSDIWVFTTGVVIDNVNEFAQASISVYPNPASQELNIGSSLNTQVGATLYSADGRVVWNNTLLPNSNHSINLASFSTGTYHLRLIAGSNMQIKEIVVVK